MIKIRKWIFVVISPILFFYSSNSLSSDLDSNIVDVYVEKMLSNKKTLTRPVNTFVALKGSEKHVSKISFIFKLFNSVTDGAFKGSKYIDANTNIIVYILKDLKKEIPEVFYDLYGKENIKITQIFENSIQDGDYESCQVFKENILFENSPHFLFIPSQAAQHIVERCVSQSLALYVGMNDQEKNLPSIFDKWGNQSHINVYERAALLKAFSK